MVTMSIQSNLTLTEARLLIVFKSTITSGSGSFLNTPARSSNQTIPVLLHNITQHSAKHLQPIVQWNESYKQPA